MAFKKQDLINQSVEVIKQNDIIFIEELISYLPCSSKTFYNYELHNLQSIKEQIEKNRVMKKVELRAKWYKSENATLQIALYKLLATTEEYSKLTNSYSNQQNEFAEPPNIIINLQGKELKDFIK
jgi:hypothetical protein